MHKLACLLTSYVMKYDDYEDKREEVYLYGFEILLGKLITYLILFMIGVLLNCLLEMAIFMTYVMILRGYTGGYHLSNRISCILGTTSICLLSIFIARTISIEIASKVLPILLLISAVYIWRVSPINHPNLRLTIKEMNKCNFFARVILVIELLVLISLIILQVKPNIIILGSLAIIVVSLLMLIAKIINQEVLNSE